VGVDPGVSEVGLVRGAAGEHQPRKDAGVAGRLDVRFGCLRVVALDDGTAPVHHESGFISGCAEFGEDGDLGGEGQESFLGDPVR